MNIDFDALWEALSQYVENTEAIEESLNAHDRAKLEAARKMLEKMDRAVAAMAEPTASSELTV